ncbi:hypothetical protein NPIL_436631 [Nephila pilipes]|uniref:Uncharacterized protein n=1 Tax=Nephila pilipes TaxID=299642 RepID=A0A8X6TGF8_NEPPI|nr:hypothetical protein NPIL_436631 [Nephila pilipes]
MVRSDIHIGVVGGSFILQDNNAWPPRNSEGGELICEVVHGLVSNPKEYVWDATRRRIAVYPVFFNSSIFDLLLTRNLALLATKLTSF